MEVVDEALEHIEDIAKDGQQQLRESEKEMRQFVLDQVKERGDANQAAAIEKINNMGNSLLTDFEKMGDDLEKALLERFDRFIDERLEPVVARLVSDEVTRKEAAAKEAEKARATEQRLEAAEKRAQAADKRARIYQAIGALGVVFGIAWGVIEVFIK